MKKTVVIGLLGINLDSGPRSVARWQKWRPSIDICRHDDFVIDRFELLHQKRYRQLNKSIMDDIAAISPETTVNSNLIEFRDPWDFEEVYAALYEFAKSYPFNTDKENYFFHITTGTHVAQICFYLLTEARYFPGKLLQTSPPKRQKSVDLGSYSIIDLDLSKYDSIANRFKKEHQEGTTYLKSGIKTKNKRFNALISRIEQVAIKSKAPILLTGPTGAGKSHLAKKIYELKKTRSLIAGNFVEVNCATIRGDNAMSTLFGHKKGSFTGALKDRDGLLRSADKGILFLDEIGELGLDEQAMLLRAVEEKQFLPVGADTETSSSFQLIAGTNRQLSKRIITGEFREDLFARINLWTFELPGLTERKEDIEPNLDYELEKLSEQEGILLSFNREARKTFLSFATAANAKWTANFRDLNASVVRMATLANGKRINITNVEEEIERLNNAWINLQYIDNNHEVLASVLSLDEISAIDAFDQPQLSNVITVCRDSNSLSDAGRKLFSVTRAKRKKTNDSDRLKKYLAKYNLQWKDLVQ